MPAKITDPVDRHVGSRIRMKRMMAGVSQETLGHHLGVTFQQIQKYEKGSNRVSASKLQQIARILGVPVAFFFDGAPGQDPGYIGADAAVGQEIADFLATSEGIQLAKAFAGIRNAKARRRVIDLIEALADEGSGVS